VTISVKARFWCAYAAVAPRGLERYWPSQKASKSSRRSASRLQALCGALQLDSGDYVEGTSDKIVKGIRDGRSFDDTVIIISFSDVLILSN